MKKNREVKNIITGIIILAMGIIMGAAYIFKFFPFDPNKSVALLAAWSYTGWMWSLLLIGWGACKIMLDNNLEGSL